MSFQEFPKWIPLPEHQDGGIVVFNAEEEKSYVVQEDQAPAEEVKKRGRPRKVTE